MKAIIKMFTFLDLFCGAGGLTLGFERAGFIHAGAADIDKSAVDTYNKNFSKAAQKLDLSINPSYKFPVADIIVGGPPCQGFSSAGAQQAADTRNDLVSRFALLICELRPKAFVFENVEGFLTAQNGHYLFGLLRPLIAQGYQIHLRKVNAANYGVPQNRKRVLAIGGLGWEPSFPEATHSAFGTPGARLASSTLPLTPTSEQALWELPLAASSPPGVPQGHFRRELQGLDLARAEALHQGQSMRDLPQELQHISFSRRANRRVIDGTPTEKRGGAPTGLRRLRADEPSKAITGGARSEFLHPQENRSLTLRECARLQGFPDNFTFYGTTSQQSQMIGNAVPPPLAQAIAENLYRDLCYNSMTRASHTEHGLLLSFIPTLSEGTSPALGKVLRDISCEFDMEKKSENNTKADEFI